MNPVRSNRRLMRRSCRKTVAEQMELIRETLAWYYKKKAFSDSKQIHEVHITSVSRSAERRLLSTAITLALRDIGLRDTKHRGKIQHLMQQNQAGKISAEELDHYLGPFFNKDENKISAFLTRTVLRLSEIDKVIEQERERHVQKN